ncbi:MAG TPA: hypothetical protein VLM76_06650 [Patescibacteria group bacterium]|nr:hypothetical protein [Patescibacteria group bacterium]
MTRSGDDPPALLLAAREAASSRYRAILARSPADRPGFAALPTGRPLAPSLPAVNRP